MSLFDDLISKAKVYAGMCAANTQLEDLQTAIRKGKNAMYFAELSSPFLSSKPGAGEQFKKAKEALGKVGEGLGKVKEVCLDIQAVGRIHTAVKILNDDQALYKEPEKAADVFGQLFVGFGRLASHLPPPANIYAPILEGCGSFFTNAQRGLGPEKRSMGRDQWEHVDGWK